VLLEHHAAAVGEEVEERVLAAEAPEERHREPEAVALGHFLALADVPAWQADGRPIYGGFFWINTEGGFPVPRDAYYMAGSGTQIALIIPSHDLVVVRMGHYRGGSPGFQSLNEALALLMEAVPARK
jgi:CubicO group peptidase (beta-lactamase class C family)